MSLQTFTQAYIEAALWSSTDTADDGTERHLDSGEFELAPETQATMEQEAKAFYDANAHLFTDENCTYKGCSVDEYAGHDFWLTRVGSGCSFMDGYWLKPVAQQLTAACKAAGHRDLYIGDDGKIYQS